MDIAEKRIYDGADARTRVVLASDTGLAIAGVSGDTIGEFGLGLRDSVVDVAATSDGRLLVATADAVLLIDPPAADADIAALPDPTTVYEGNPSAVSSLDGSVVVGGDDGVRRRERDGRWTLLGDPGELRSVDAPLLAAESGVHRIDGGTLTAVGLDDPRDVSAGSPLLAGTPDGLYRLGNGWLSEVAGECTAVDSAGGDALAVVDRTVRAIDDGGWTDLAWPPEQLPVSVAVEGGRYAVTEDGTLAVDVGDGWCHRNLGVRSVTACAVWQV